MRHYLEVAHEQELTNMVTCGCHHGGYTEENDSGIIKTVCPTKQRNVMKNKVLTLPSWAF